MVKPKILRMMSKKEDLRKQQEIESRRPLRINGRR